MKLRVLLLASLMLVLLGSRIGAIEATKQYACETSPSTEGVPSGVVEWADTKTKELKFLDTLATGCYKKTFSELFTGPTNNGWDNAVVVRRVSQILYSKTYETLCGLFTLKGSQKSLDCALNRIRSGALENMPDPRDNDGVDEFLKHSRFLGCVFQDPRAAQESGVFELSSE